MHILGSAGSIPALAGERDDSGPVIGKVGVYPRACGGTCFGYDIRPCVQGLSPRLRGNACALYGRQLLLGSIPALAGERPLQSLP